jgi:hypothetical protein
MGMDDNSLWDGSLGSVVRALCSSHSACSKGALSRFGSAEYDSTAAESVSAPESGLSPAVPCLSQLTLRQIAAVTRADSHSQLCWTC